METDFKTGAALRVVDFMPQFWSVIDEDEGCARAEQSLLGCYLGKIGHVKTVDDWRMPVLLEFSESSRVPMTEMRFHASEVEDVG